MNNARHYDLIVLGAGPAGYSAAIRAAQRGATVLIVDKGSFGGTCLNRGCIPTKFLWQSVSLGKKMKRAADIGIDGTFTAYNFPLMQQKKSRTTDILGKGVRKLLEGYNIALAEGTARFISGNSIEIEGADASRITATAKNIIIATGSEPKPIPGLPYDHTRIIDSTDALNLTKAPASLLIIGGGAIGIELATIYVNLGSEVMIIEKEPQLLPGEDTELSREVEKNLLRMGVKVTTSSGAFDDLLPRFEKVLVVTGRKPSLEGLALEKAGIAFTPRGITVNDRLETSAPGIYAAGDATGRAYLAYTAQTEGTIAADNALGDNQKAPDFKTVPHVVFCQPPAASVGIREIDAPEGAIAVGRFPLAANSRAFIEGERTGWVKLVTEKTSGRVLGGQVIGPHAEDLIAVISLAVNCRLTIHDLRRDMFFHPSLSEAVHSAAEASTGMSVELPPAGSVVKK